jgi:TolB-like protein/DNA-binding winged helix-turn-helix (wHTH) protein/Tfp pilus assembly protein PilF
MSATPSPPVDFDGFTLDLACGCLRRGCDEIKLRPKSFDVLRYLVENRGRLLSKEELIRAVWGYSSVTDNSLVQCLIEVRRALGDQNQVLIRTVPRRGYIFEPTPAKNGNGDQGHAVGSETEHAAEVPPPANGSVVASPPQVPPAQQAGVAPENSRISRNWIAAIALMSSITVIALAIWELSSAFGTRPTDSLAVLPFQSVAQASGDEYLELGMADALITRLSTVKQLTVRPTSSVRPFIGTSDALSAGKRLGVGAVVDGSVQKLGDRIRISARLVRVADGKSLWADTYDESFSDIFSVQDAVSAKIASALSITLSGEEAGRLTKRYGTNTEAYQLYLRGKFFWERRNAGDVEKAARFFEQAIQKDSNYAPGYAALANAYGPMLQGHLLRPKEGLPKMEEAIRRALELDPTLAEAHIAMAAARFNEWDFSGAERESRRAIELNPSDALAHNWYGYYLGAVGRHEDHVREARRALALDPLSRMSNGNLATGLFNSGQYTEALEQTNRALALDSNLTTAIQLRAALHARMHQYTEALEEFRKMGDLMGVAEVEARFGNQNAARAAFARFVQSYPAERPLPQVEIACFFSLLGDTDEAFRRLELAYGEHDSKFLFLKSAPELEPLRKDARFAFLLNRVGL